MRNLSACEGRERINKTLADPRVLNARGLVYGCLFLSGMAGLIYEVLWMKELGLLFGNTAHAAATTLTSFFLGLSAGSYYWGRRVERCRNPLRTYAFLETGVALSALAYFVILSLYRTLYPHIFGLFGEQSGLFLATKFAMSLGLLFLPSFFMGGTLPVMAQALIESSREIGIEGSLIYAINTSGAVLGAFSAGFLLPLHFGFRNSYLIAISLNLFIAAVAFVLGRNRPAVLNASATPTPQHSNTPVLHDTLRSEFAPTPSHHQIPGYLAPFLAFFTGFAALALEVLWTQMFAQVLQNSVYTFSAVLVMFLIALAAGAVLSSKLSELNVTPVAFLISLFALASLLTAATPHVLTAITHGLDYLSPRVGWWSYVGSVFYHAAIVMLAPGIVIGAVFPFLLNLYRSSEDHCPGRTLGHLTAANTLGAIAGALTAGFVMLNVIGLWRGIYLVAAVYGLLGTLLGIVFLRHWLARIVTPVSVAFLLFVLFPAKATVLWQSEVDEELLETWESNHGIVSVVRLRSDLKIRYNNHYTLGSSVGLVEGRRQAELPLIVHGEPKSVLFIGLATGITPGASLRFPVEQVTVCELVPDVVAASKKHFERYTNGLFTDSRVRIAIEDGRNYLAGRRETYDVIIGDLFFPWKAGSGSLYAIAHFQSVKRRLSEGGLYCQWLPLFQTSRREFSSITRTMLETFPQVTLWRGDFYQARPIVALIGHSDPSPLIPDVMVRSARSLAASHGQSSDSVTVARPFLYYAGNLTANREMFTGAPINTDDRPLIEYLAPMTQRNQTVGRASWLTGSDLLGLLEKLNTRTPPDKDPMLVKLTSRQKRTVQEGLKVHRSNSGNQRLKSVGMKDGAVRLQLPAWPAPGP
ncbi:MAG: fused MFS/spermidine synthase [Planctomycetota bacterium]|nr:fused MFS/spermidine synthase [Planctomycetota bacterium]MDP7130929.1 fused MFS/spermidine synthase [Planctomycetota bacterium]MDP7248123.1 fused MFS/spermidine synthase [Planctomycetota bacterium]